MDWDKVIYARNQGVGWAIWDRYTGMLIKSNSSEYMDRIGVYYKSKPMVSKYSIFVIAPSSLFRRLYNIPEDL